MLAAEWAPKAKDGFPVTARFPAKDLAGDQDQDQFHDPVNKWAVNPAQQKPRNDNQDQGR